MKNAIHNRVKSAILTMLEESDRLDYSVVHTPDKLGCSIYAATMTLQVPTLRIVLSQPANWSDMLAVKAMRGHTNETLMDTQYLGGVHSAETEAKVLATITELIEDADNSASQHRAAANQHG